MMKEWWGAGSRFRGSRQKYETWRWNTKSYIRGRSTQTPREGGAGGPWLGRNNFSLRWCQASLTVLWGRMQQLCCCHKYAVVNRSCKMFDKRDIRHLRHFKLRNTIFEHFSCQTQFLNILHFIEWILQRPSSHADQDHSLTHNGSAEEIDGVE